MSVTNTSNKVREQGNGSKTVFTFAFKIFAASELQVYNVVRATNVATLKTITTHYTVQISTTGEGGTVTWVTAPSAAQDSLILRVVPYSQEADIPTESNFPEEQIENQLDRLCMMTIQLKEEVDRCVQVGVAETAFSTDELETAVADAQDAAAAALASEIAAAASASAAAASAVAAAASAAAATGVVAKVGSFTRDTSLASGSQAITGIGFQPKAVFIIALQDQSIEMSVGMSSGASANASGYSRSAIVSDTWATAASNLIFALESAGVFYAGNLASFNADGFTISWTKTGSPTGVLDLLYLALG